MAVQLNTKSLTKSQQFSWEACKILWRHKKIFFIFAALPIVLDIIDTILSDKKFLELEYYRAVDYYREVVQYAPNTHWPSKGNFESYYLLISQISYFLKWLIALPLLGRAWLKYLLESTYKPSLQAYFKIDCKVGKFIIYSLLILSLCFAWRLLAPFLEVSQDRLLISLYLIFKYFYLSFPLIIICLVIFYFISSSMLLLPFIAVDKSMVVREILKQITPYRRGFSWEIIAFLFLLIYLPNALQSSLIDFFAGHSNAARVQSYLFIISLHVIKFLFIYLIIGVILSFVAISYIEYFQTEQR